MAGRRVRILWLKPTKGNISVGRYLLAEELKKLGYDIRIVESSGKDIFKALVYGLFSDYDLIVGVVRVGAYVGFVLSKIRGKPFIADVTDPYHQVSYLPRILYNFFKKYEEFVLKNADQIIFIYKKYMQEMKLKGVDGVKLDNGVSFEKFARPNPKNIVAAVNILEQHGVKLDRPIILYVGALTNAYNIDLILRVAKKLKNYNFVFIGSGCFRDKIKENAVELENIFYLGTFEHDLIPGFVSVSDVCLCLVDAEQPLKILEYGAAGKPTVALKGELEMRFTDKDIYFINPTEAELLKALKLLTENAKEGRKRGVRLRKRVRKYDWKEIARKYGEIINSIIG